MHKKDYWLYLSNQLINTFLMDINLFFWKVELHKFDINLLVIEVNNVIQFCFVVLSIFEFFSLFKIMFFFNFFNFKLYVCTWNSTNYTSPSTSLKISDDYVWLIKNVVTKRWWWLISKRKKDWLPNSIMECQHPQASISLHLLTLKITIHHPNTPNKEIENLNISYMQFTRNLVESQR
jgi:hypothetical protein